MCRIMIKLTKEFECFTLWKLSSVTARDWRHEESKFLFMTKNTTNISKSTEIFRHLPLPLMFKIMAWKRLLSNIWDGYHKLWGNKLRREVMWQNWVFLYLMMMMKFMREVMWQNWVFLYFFTYKMLLASTRNHRYAWNWHHGWLNASKLISVMHGIRPLWCTMAQKINKRYVTLIREWRVLQFPFQSQNYEGKIKIWK